MFSSSILSIKSTPYSITSQLYFTECAGHGWNVGDCKFLFVTLCRRKWSTLSAWINCIKFYDFAEDTVCYQWACECTSTLLRLTRYGESIKSILTNERERARTLAYIHFIAYSQIQNINMENVFELCAISERSIKIKTKQSKAKQNKTQAKQSNNGCGERACYAWYKIDLP